MLRKYQNNSIPNLSNSDLGILERHLDYVLEANKSLRLTAIDDKEEGIRLHIIDSLLVFEELANSQNGKILDLGTGGGFPGIPLAIASGRPTMLLDSIQKKIKALDIFIERENLTERGISTLGVRAEELALTHQGEFSTVLARAVSALPALVELSSPLLKSGGRLIAYKGLFDHGEFEKANTVAELSGMKFISKREYKLPHGDEERIVYVYEKVCDPLIRLPRRPGQAQRRPLA